MTLGAGVAFRPNILYNYRRFLEMVNALQVVTEIKNRSGSKYFGLNRAEIEKQLRLVEANS